MKSPFSTPTDRNCNEENELMNNERENQPHDLDLPRFIKNNGGSIEDDMAIMVTERPAVSVAAEASAAAHVADMLAKLADLIKVPPDVPPIGADAALKILKCFEIVAADVRAIAADRVKAAEELRDEAESYAVVLLEAGKVLATRVSAESARAYKLSHILQEAREVIAGSAPGERAN